MHFQPFQVGQVAVLVDGELAIASVERAIFAAMVSLEDEHTIALDGHVRGEAGCGEPALREEFLHGHGRYAEALLAGSSDELLCHGVGKDGAGGLESDRTAVCDVVTDHGKLRAGGVETAGSYIQCSN